MGQNKEISRNKLQHPYNSTNSNNSNDSLILVVQVTSNLGRYTSQSDYIMTNRGEGGNKLTALDIVTYDVVNVVGIHPPLRADPQKRQDETVGREIIRCCIANHDSFGNGGAEDG